MRKPPQPPAHRQSPPKSTLTRTAAVAAKRLAAKRRITAARASYESNSAEKGSYSPFSPSRDNAAIEKQSEETSSPRSVLCPIQDHPNSTTSSTTTATTRSFVMRRLNDTIYVLTKESARLNPLSSNVKSGSDGLLLVSNSSIKHSNSAIQQKQETHSDAISSKTTSPEVEVNLTFMDLVGITIAEGTNKNNGKLSRWQQSMSVQQNTLPSGVQAAITLPSETTHYLHHIPSFPLQKSNEKDNYATAQWDGSNHATVNISQLMRKNIKKHVNIILLVSLIYEEAIIPFGVAILDMSSFSSSDTITEEKCVHVQGVSLPICHLTSNKSIRMIHRLLYSGEHCTLRVRVDKQQSRHQKPELLCELPSSLIEEVVVRKPQNEEATVESSLLERLSVIEDVMIEHSLTKEGYDMNKNSSFEVCITNEYPYHNSKLMFESEQNGMDAFEEKFGLTRLMQSIESIGFQLFDSVKMLNALTGGQCNAAITTIDDLAEAPSIEELWWNDGESIKMSNRNNSASSYSVEDQIDPSDSAKHFQGGVGTLIAERYIINRDLGIGTFGRVVACEDMHQQHRDEFGRRVAIKIVRNDAKDIEAAFSEADILRHINSHSDPRGTSLCVALLHQFYFLDRRHYCLVFESLGSSLYDFMKNHDFQPFPLYCVRDFTHQLLDALEFLHSIKLIHTDLKPENILLVSDKAKEYSSFTNSGRLTHAIVPESTRIKLIDFGGATFDNDHKSTVINTREYRAPEVLLKLSSGWSYPSDMWSLGCILVELYTGECLFLASNKYEHFALIDGVVGPFPKHMIDNSPLAKPFFDSNGRFRRQALSSKSSQSIVEQVKPLESMNINIHNTNNNEDQAFGLLQLLMKLLVIDPCLRATALEAFQSPFSSGCHLNY